ncbi:hypothetical protein CTAYLR_004153 [Chrysophaeum taylorii]|uniref:Uncharacterized protein n=1 Tax=Chrysophaeum taylorii TaxID=2483200 RepID=A0AAD7UMH0_9STRA|nr:hypothetical protein CTAYLR_004153 [Chrysophaeum taylorii]
MGGNRRRRRRQAPGLWALAVVATAAVALVRVRGGLILGEKNHVMWWSSTSAAGTVVEEESRSLLSCTLDVKGWLEAHGTNTSGMLFPARMEAEWEPWLLAGRNEYFQGGGLVAFNVVFEHEGKHHYVNASYVVVTEFRSPCLIVNVLVGTRGMCDGEEAARFRALKLFSSRELLLGAHCDENELGPTMLWEFATVADPPKIRVVAGDRWLNSHDAEVLENGASILRPARSHQNVVVVDTADGSVKRSYDVYNSTVALWFPDAADREAFSAYAPDVNHVVLAKRKLAANLRYFSAFVVVDWDKAFFRGDDVGSGAVDYVAGGRFSTLLQLRRNGTVVDHRDGNGASLFYGAHNLEMVRHSKTRQTFVLFDNGFDAHTKEAVHETSRLLLLEVDTNASTLAEAWYYELDHQAPIYGDADLTPSRSVMSCSWPAILTNKTAYDFQLFMVAPTADTTGGRIDWAIRGYATMDQHHCVDYPCVRLRGKDAPQGWSTYSVERFWEAPQIRSARCASFGESNEAKLELSDLFDVTKWAHDKNATVSVFLLKNTDTPELIDQRHVTLHAFWNPASLDLVVSAVPAGATIGVKLTNADGVDSPLVTVNCATSGGSPSSEEKKTHTDALPSPFLWPTDD